MKSLTALLLLASTLCAADPYPSISSPQLDIPEPGVINVTVGVPPQVDLFVSDPPEGSVQTWNGPLGKNDVGRRTPEGVSVSTSVPGIYEYRCVIQTPVEGLDPLVILDMTVVVQGTSPVPPIVVPPVVVPPVVVPPPPPTDFSTRLTDAVKANPAAHERFGRVAAAYELVAETIKSGVLTTPTQVTSMTNVLTSAASPEWAAIETNIVKPHLTNLGLTTAAQHEGPWRQIAAAVRAGLTDIPPPDVVPLPVTGLHVLIIEEMDDRSGLPASQVSIFSSTKLWDWFAANNVQWRQFDYDADLSLVDQKWKDAMARPRQSTPWIIASNGTSGYEGPLPKSVDETITLLEKYK